MEIRINKLRLRNFKGTRSAEYDFHLGNARIEGPNGSGKSTVFDAFTWLLFGKDHKGQTTDTFELKTIDPATGKPFPREDHWVEAELIVDGKPTTIRRVWSENWVKPTGQIEDVMKGHTGAFFVDGVNVGTKKAYDTVIAGWINEDAFKLLTNPFYFIDDAFTPWKERRRALLDLVKGDPARAKIREEFADLIKGLSGRDIDAYRKQLAAEKSANKRDLAAILNRIDGMRDALPEAVDEDAVRDAIAKKQEAQEKLLAPLLEERDALDRSIASADGADEARKAENARIWAEITAVQLWMKERTAEARNAAISKNNAIAEDLRKAEFNLHDAEDRLEFLKNEGDRLRASIASDERELGKAAADLEALRKDYDAEKAKFFNYKPSTRCPNCGQEMPAETIEKAIARAREDFQRERKEAKDAILSKATSIKEAGEKAKARIEGYKERLQKNEEQIQEAGKSLSALRGTVAQLRATPAIDVNAEENKVRESEAFRAKVKEEMDLRGKAMATSSRPDDLEELVQRRKDVDAQIAQAREENARQLEPIKARLAVNQERKRQEKLIAEAEHNAKNFADAVARCERQEARVAEFVQRDVETVNAAIDGIFHVARWKMFDQTLDGAFVETCEVTSQDGVPYRSMNDAMKILCGLDCIRVFSEHFGMKAPIFVDNAECIIQSAFDTDAQVIRLVVKDCDELTIINE